MCYVPIPIYAVGQCDNLPIVLHAPGRGSPDGWHNIMHKIRAICSRVCLCWTVIIIIVI